MQLMPFGIVPVQHRPHREWMLHFHQVGKQMWQSIPVAATRGVQGQSRTAASSEKGFPLGPPVSYRSKADKAIVGHLHRRRHHVSCWEDALERAEILNSNA